MGKDGIDAAAHLGADAGLLGAKVEEGHRRAGGRRWGGALLGFQAHPGLVWFRGVFRKFPARGAEAATLASWNKSFCFFFQKEALSFLLCDAFRQEAVLFCKKEPKNFYPVRMRAVP
jgi:hypothetical protein